MKAIVLGNRIMVEIKENPYHMKDSKIIIPENAKALQSLNFYAEVVEVGSEVKSVSIGDFIMFSKHAGHPVELNLPYVVLRDLDVLVVIKNEETE